MTILAVNHDVKEFVAFRALQTQSLVQFSRDRPQKLNNLSKTKSPHPTDGLPTTEPPIRNRRQLAPPRPNVALQDGPSASRTCKPPRKRPLGETILEPSHFSNIHRPHRTENLERYSTSAAQRIRSRSHDETDSRVRPISPMQDRSRFKLFLNHRLTPTKIPD